MKARPGSDQLQGIPQTPMVSVGRLSYDTTWSVDGRRQCACLNGLGCIATASESDTSISRHRAAVQRGVGRSRGLLPQPVQLVQLAVPEANHGQVEDGSLDQMEGRRPGCRLEKKRCSRRYRTC